MARLRLFANLRELAGASQVEIEGDTVGAILDEAADRYGAEFGRRLGYARVWLNGQPATAGDPVGDLDELALIPPVSGGANQATLTVSGIQVALIAAALAAKGESRISPLETVERGYEGLVERLKSLGASVETETP